MKFDRDHSRVKAPTLAAGRPAADHGMACGERWLFGLLFAAVLFALGHQLMDTSRFVRHLPEFADTIRLWLSNLS